MDDISEILRQSGLSPLDDDVHARLLEWQDEVFRLFKKANLEDHPRVKFGARMPLHLLPFEDRVRMMGKYREAIGLNLVLSEFAKTGPTAAASETPVQRGISNIWDRLNVIRDIDEDAPYARFRGQSGDSILNRVYAAINLQRNMQPRDTVAGMPFSEKIASPDLHYGFTSPQKLGSLSRATMPSDLAGKTIAVFDIETAGFATGSIREVAYEMIRIGESVPLDKDTIPFKTRQFERGVMAHGDQPLSLGHFMATRYPSKGGSMASVGAPSGEEFINRMMPILEKFRQADYVAGHNIESFDIPQIFESLGNTKKYQTDAAFRRTVDSLHDNITSKTIDTLRLAREAPNLSGIKISPKIAGEGRAYSIENLLLNTDLAERIGFDKLQAAMGYDRATGTFKKGLHFADVDTLITTGLIENVHDLEQKPLSSRGDAATGRFIKALHRQIETSAAITPFTNIRNPDDIHPRVAQLMRERGIGQVNPIEQEVLLSRDLQRGLTRDAIDAAEAGLPSRRILPTLGVFDRVIGRSAGMTHGDMYQSGVRTSPIRFGNVVDKFADAGLPFAGLSYEERLFSTGLSSLTAGITDTGFSQHAIDSGVSRFSLFDLETMQWKTRSGKMTLPPQVLNHLGLLNNADDPAMFSLSVVDKTIQSEVSSVNVTYRLERERDLARVADLLEEMSSSRAKFSEVLGGPDSTVSGSAFDNFQEYIQKDSPINALREGGVHDISIVQIRDPETTEGVIEFLKRANNTSELRDDKTLRFMLPFMDLEFDSAGRGFMRTAGAILGVGIGQQEKSSIGTHVRMMRAIYSPPIDKGKGMGYLGLASSSRVSQTARNAAAATNQKGQEAIVNAFTAVKSRKMPKLIGAGLLAIAGAYAYRSKRDMDQYDVAFSYAGKEAGQDRYMLADHIQQRQQGGYDGYRQQMDPLATASLSKNLSYIQTNHHDMSWDRNNNIYGGVL